MVLEGSCLTCSHRLSVLLTSLKQATLSAHSLITNLVVGHDKQPFTPPPLFWCY